MNKRFTISFENTTIAFVAKSNWELFITRWIFAVMNSEMFTKIGTFLIKSALLFHIPIKFIIKHTLFKQFCGGESLDDCKNTANLLVKSKIGIIPDYSIEGENSKKAFLNSMHEILKSIKWVRDNPEASFAVFKCTAIGNFDLIQKVQSQQTLTAKESIEYQEFKDRFYKICETAAAYKVKLLIDAEESWIQDVIDSLSLEAMKKHNKEQAIVFNTFQMYREDKLSHLQECYEMALANGFYLGVKLVRGAYLEKENAYAAKNDIVSKIHRSKGETDRAYNAALAFCCIYIPFIYLCAGSHNEKSNELLASLTAEMDQEFSKRIYFAQLYGMGDHISYNLANYGFQVSKYLPYGPIYKLLPYLFRRAEENKSINGQASKELQIIKEEIRRRKSAKLD